MPSRRQALPIWQGAPHEAGKDVRILKGRLRPPCLPHLREGPFPKPPWMGPGFPLHGGPKNTERERIQGAGPCDHGVWLLTLFQGSKPSRSSRDAESLPIGSRTQPTRTSGNHALDPGLGRAQATPERRSRSRWSAVSKRAASARKVVWRSAPKASAKLRICCSAASSRMPRVPLMWSPSAKAARRHPVRQSGAFAPSARPPARWPLPRRRRECREMGRCRACAPSANRADSRRTAAGWAVHSDAPSPAGQQVAQEPRPKAPAKPPADL